MFKLNFTDKILSYIAIFLALCLLGGILAGQYDPRQIIILAFLGLAYPFLLALNIFMILIWLLRKKYFFAILTCLLIAYGTDTLKATFSISGTEGDIEKKEHHIRVMTYNVHNFKIYGEKNQKETKNKIFEVIKNQNPDIICFQEYFTRFKGEYNITDSLKKILQTPYFYFEPSTKNNYEALGLAIFSKYPILNKDKVDFKLKHLGNGSIFIDVEINQKPLRIYNLHLQSISFDKQDYNYIEQITKEINPNEQSSKRIVKMLAKAFKKRAEQVNIMKNELEKCTSSYIIAGDFNDTPASFTVTQLTKKLNNAFIQQGFGFGKTYNGKFPNFQIDYIATTKDIAVKNYCIIGAKISDHFPVRSDLSFR